MRFGTVHAKGTPRLLHHKQGYDYIVNYKQARRFLTIIEPFLRVKKDKVSKLLDEEGRLYELQVT